MQALDLGGTVIFLDAIAALVPTEGEEWQEQEYKTEIWLISGQFIKSELTVREILDLWKQLTEAQTD